jgi:hypothetical protein
MKKNLIYRSFPILIILIMAEACKKLEPAANPLKVQTSSKVFRKVNAKL